MSEVPRLLSVEDPVDPPKGLTYPLALRREGSSPFQSAFGILAGFSAFALIVPLAA